MDSIANFWEASTWLVQMPVEIHTLDWEDSSYQMVKKANKMMNQNKKNCKFKISFKQTFKLHDQQQMPLEVKFKWVKNN